MRLGPALSRLLAVALILMPGLKLAAATERAQIGFAALRDPVALLFHAATTPGLGYPAGFTHDDYSTQRNLSPPPPRPFPRPPPRPLPANPTLAPQKS